MSHSGGPSPITNPSPQRAFAAGLLDPALPVPPGLVSWNGSDVAPRYAVYRNNVASSLLRALEDTFPACARVLGSAAFRDLARCFLRAAPPRSPWLAEYGASFPDFIAQWLAHAPAANPALADLARLEFLRVQAFHAAEAIPLTAAQWAGLLARPAQLPDLRLGLHPSLSMLDSRHPVVSLWAAQQADDGDTPQAFEAATAQSAVILRPDAEVIVLAVTSGFTSLLRQLGSGIALGRAAARARAADAAFDLDASLALVIRHGLVATISADTGADGVLAESGAHE